MSPRPCGTRAFVVLMGLGLGPTSWPARASAESPSNSVDTAQALFDQARQLIGVGHYEEACPKLEESQRLDPGSGTLLNLADCYEHRGRIASAFATFLEAAAAAHTAGNIDREQTARERAAGLSAKVPKLVISVAADRTAGLEIRRDGQALGRAQWDAAFPADPGEHAITASAPGRKSWRQTVVVGTLATVVTVAVPELERQAIGTEPLTPGAPAATFGTQKILALAAGGIGVVGVAVGSVFGLQSISKRHEADKSCSATTCTDQSSVDLTGDAISAGNFATVAFAVGAAGLAAGTVLWFTAPPQTAVARVGIGMGTVQVQGAW